MINKFVILCSLKICKTQFIYFVHESILDIHIRFARLILNALKNLLLICKDGIETRELTIPEQQSRELH